VGGFQSLLGFTLTLVLLELFHPFLASGLHFFYFTVREFGDCFSAPFASLPVGFYYFVGRGRLSSQPDDLIKSKFVTDWQINRQTVKTAYVNEKLLRTQLADV